MEGCNAGAAFYIPPDQSSEASTSSLVACHRFQLKGVLSHESKPRSLKQTDVVKFLSARFGTSKLERLERAEEFQQFAV